MYGQRTIYGIGAVVEPDTVAYLDGLEILSIGSRSPFAKSSLRPGDVLVNLNGFDMRDLSSFHCVVPHLESKKGPRIDVTLGYYQLSTREYVRESIVENPKAFRGVPFSCRVRLSDPDKPSKPSPSPPPTPATETHLDVTLRERVSRKEALMVRRVIYGLPAQRAGIEEGDVIETVDDLPLDGDSELLTDVFQTLGKRYGTARSITLRVRRDGRLIDVPIGLHSETETVVSAVRPPESDEGSFRKQPETVSPPKPQTQSPPSASVPEVSQIPETPPQRPEFCEPWDIFINGVCVKRSLPAQSPTVQSPAEQAAIAPTVPSMPLEQAGSAVPVVTAEVLMENTVKAIQTTAKETVTPDLEVTGVWSEATAKAAQLYVQQLQVHDVFKDGWTGNPDGIYSASFAGHMHAKLAEIEAKYEPDDKLRTIAAFVKALDFLKGQGLYTEPAPLETSSAVVEPSIPYEPPTPPIVDPPVIPDPVSHSIDNHSEAAKLFFLNGVFREFGDEFFSDRSRQETQEFLRHYAQHHSWFEFLPNVFGNWWSLLSLVAYWRAMAQKLRPIKAAIFGIKCELVECAIAALGEVLTFGTILSGQGFLLGSGLGIFMTASTAYAIAAKCRR